MSLSGGPKITKEGLVLLLDATNEKSYPGEGQTWYDISGYKNHGTQQYSPVWSEEYFETNNGYFNIQHSDSLDFTGSLTACMWAKSDSSGGFGIYWSGISRYSQFILGPNGTSNSPMAFLIYTNNWYPSGYGNASLWGQSELGLDYSQWHYYVGVYESENNQNKLYIDGELIVTLPTSGTLKQDNDTIDIGNRESSDKQTLKGDIASVQVYNRSLNQEEVIKNFNATKRRFNF